MENQTGLSNSSSHLNKQHDFQRIATPFGALKVSVLYSADAAGLLAPPSFMTGALRMPQQNPVALRKSPTNALQRPNIITHPQENASSNTERSSLTSTTETEGNVSLFSNLACIKLSFIQSNLTSIIAFSNEIVDEKEKYEWFIISTNE